MTLLQMEIFLVVVKTGSFTKAGEVLGLTQSAVSHAIAGLESELDVSLLGRNRTGINLTYAGERLLVHIKEILYRTELIRQEAAAINDLEVGTIRIGSFPSVSTKLLPGMIKTFKKNHPGIKIELLEGGYEDINKWIASTHVDTGFVILPHKDFESVPVLEDQYVVLLPEDHPLSNKCCIHINDIAEEPFIMPLAGCEIFVRAIFKDNNITSNIHYEIEQSTTITALVRDGLGISIIPEMVYIPPGVITVKLKPELCRRIGLAVRSFQSSSPATRAFLNHAQSWVK